jgi:hypothetical protein
LQALGTVNTIDRTRLLRCSIRQRLILNSLWQTGAAAVASGLKGSNGADLLTATCQ